MRFEEYIQKNKLHKVLTSKEDWKFEVSWLITEARLFTGLTQAKLAKKMKTKQPSIARVESGRMLPSLEFLDKLAKAIGTELILPKFKFMEVPMQQEHISVSPYFQVSPPNHTKGHLKLSSDTKSSSTPFN
jgi:transcriptional regulator with XRE-family HTH domain